MRNKIFTIILIIFIFIFSSWVYGGSFDTNTDNEGISEQLDTDIDKVINNDSHNEMDNDGTSGYPSNDNDSINDNPNVDQDD